MKQRLFAATAALVVACSVAAMGFAPEKDPKTDPKPAEPSKMATDAPKETMYKVQCPTPCEFSVKGHDKAEIVMILKEHAKKHHHMEMSDKEAEDMVKPVEPQK